MKRVVVMTSRALLSLRLEEALLFVQQGFRSACRWKIEMDVSLARSP